MAHSSDNLQTECARLPALLFRCDLSPVWLPRNTVFICFILAMSAHNALPFSWLQRTSESDMQLNPQIESVKLATLRPCKRLRISHTHRQLQFLWSRTPRQFRPLSLNLLAYKSVFMSNDLHFKKQYSWVQGEAKWQQLHKVDTLQTKHPE